MFGAEFTIEGLGAERAVDKLARGGVLVLRAEMLQKNAVRIRVDWKDGKKVFAILRGSCYNIAKVRSVGRMRVLRSLMGRAGLIVGAAVFLLTVIFFQGRVLRISVVGSGAYYREEILSLLAENGTQILSEAPEDRSAIASRVLALPRVSFCSVSHGGGVLTVRVEVEDEAEPLAAGAMIAPRAGVVESLTVIRGRACVAVGDEVSAGTVLAEPTSLDGAVIARAGIRYAVDTEYAGSEESALAQSYLDYGELTDIHTQKTENGWRITGSAVAVISQNLG